LSVSAFVMCAFGIIFKKPLSSSVSWRFSSIFFF
jgi:hypothetical protein